MYQGFYGLKADPFRLTADHRFCYSHRSYARAKAYVQYALYRAEGFVLVTGRPGTGKTTLVADLLASLPNNEAVVGTLVSTQLEAEDLLLMTGHAFGLTFESHRKALVLQRLAEFFRAQHALGRRVLLIIDEAQDLAPSALEELRMLTNLQHAGVPLLQIALLGQEGLRDIVRAPEMEQVHQRLIAAWQLEPLSPEETVGYVRHRLEQAGWQGDPALAQGVLEMVYRFSKGIPRRINLICSRLLMHGFTFELHSISAADAETVVRELGREELAPQNYETDGARRESAAPKARGAVPVSRDDAVWNGVDSGLFHSSAAANPGPVASVTSEPLADEKPPRWEPPAMMGSGGVAGHKVEKAVAETSAECREAGPAVLEPVRPLRIEPTVGDVGRRVLPALQGKPLGQAVPGPKSRLSRWIAALSILWLVLLAAFLIQDSRERPMQAAEPRISLQGSNAVVEATRSRVPRPGTGAVTDEGAKSSFARADAFASDGVVPLPVLGDALLLRGSVFFRFNSTTVDAEFLPLIDEVIEQLLASEHTYAEVIGYTDRYGPVDYNLGLSRERASAVADLLIARGVPAERLLIEGQGPRDPGPDKQVSQRGERAVEISVRREASQ